MSDRISIRERILQRFTPITSNMVSETGSSNSGVAPSTPLFDLAYSPTSVARTTNPIIGSNRPAPFDTVYERGQSGARRHIFGYDDQGNLIDRTTQIASTQGWAPSERIVCAHEDGRITQRMLIVYFNGNWRVHRGEIYSFTPSGLLSTKTEYSGWNPKNRNIWSYQYDHEGQVISSRYEFHDGIMDVPRYSWFDSVVYNAARDVIYSRDEYWSRGDLINAGETIVSTTDTSVIYASTYWQRGEWLNGGRLIESGSPEDGHEILHWQTWGVAGWIDTELWATVYDDEGRRKQFNAYQWLDGVWVDMYRNSYAYWESGYGEYGDTWNGTGWDPLCQRTYTTDDLGRTLTASGSYWDNGWAPESKYTVEYAADGGTQESDSTWKGRQLERYLSRWTDGAGRELFNEQQSWDETRNTWGGSQYIATYRPDGQIAEEILRYWSDGSWHPETRWVVAYDDAHRARSAQFFVGRGEQWVAPSDIPGNDGSYIRWGTREFVPDDPAMYFYGFDALTFTYRTGLAEVGATAGEKPERSAMSQNFPNPFNPTTTIPFTVATGAQTTIAIYDVLGREVARPVEGWKDPGEYRVQFDATGLASGMYVCRFTTGSLTQVRAIMLVR